MVRFSVVPRDVTARKWAERAAVIPPAPALPPERRNVAAVLDLGNATYFTFRGRAYGVPPLPWKAGEHLTHLWLQALRRPEGPRSEEGARDYYGALAQLPRFLWRHCRPCGPWRRLLRRLGLLRNPFAHASEQELVDVAAFFFQCRTKSRVGLLTATPTRPARSTS